MKPRVTVVITCYNKGKWIERAIQSVVDMAYKDWECIVVDNGSTDNSYEIISNCVNNDSRFNYIKLKDNIGQCRGRNIGAFISESEYLIFVDGDDEIGHDFLAKEIPYMDVHPNCYAVFGNIIECVDGKLDPNFIKPLDGSLEYNYNIELSSNLLSISTLCRTKRFKEIGGFREEARHTTEDWEMWIRYLDGHEAFYDNEITSTIRYTYINNSLSYQSGMYTKTHEQELDEIIQLNKDIYTKHKQYTITRKFVIESAKFIQFPAENGQHHTQFSEYLEKNGFNSYIEYLPSISKSRYVNLPGNMHHYTVDYSMKYVVPKVLSMCGGYTFDLSQYHKKENIIDTPEGTLDFSYYIPNKENNFTIYGLDDDLTINNTDIRWHDEYPKSTKGYNNYDEYDRQYVFFHGCSKIINNTIDSNEKLLIVGDSQILPSLNILVNYYKEVWYWDNRNGEPYFNDYLQGNEFDYILFELWSGDIEYRKPEDFFITRLK